MAGRFNLHGQLECGISGSTHGFPVYIEHYTIEVSLTTHFSLHSLSNMNVWCFDNPLAHPEKSDISRILNALNGLIVGLFPYGCNMHLVPYMASHSKDAGNECVEMLCFPGESDQ